MNSKPSSRMNAFTCFLFFGEKYSNIPLSLRFFFLDIAWPIKGSSRPTVVLPLFLLNRFYLLSGLGMRILHGLLLSY